MQPQTVSLYCEKFDKRSEGSALRRDFTTHERLTRAAKMGGILWGVGFFTIFIPVLHFVLPPLFVLAGVAMAAVTYLEKGQLLSGEIPCPSCGHKLEFPVETESWPNARRCPSCHVDLVIKKP